jgi:hypothetical protein
LDNAVQPEAQPVEEVLEPRRGVVVLGYVRKISYLGSLSKRIDMPTRINFTQRPIQQKGKITTPITLQVGDTFTLHHRTYVIQQINAADSNGGYAIYLHSPSDPSPVKPRSVVVTPVHSKPAQV